MGRWQQLCTTVHVRDSPLPHSHPSAFWVVTGWHLIGRDFASNVLGTAEGSTATPFRVQPCTAAQTLTDGTHHGTKNLLLRIAARCCMDCCCCC
jgi:hypothetical protein